MVQVGDWQIRSVVNGHVRLDGGAMFGVVPKVLWCRNQDVDDQNRILLATRTLLAANRSAGRLVLADTGTGTKWRPGEAERYGVDPLPTAIDEALASLGADADTVTDVIATHLHFDHAGGMTEWLDDPGGPTRLRFPNAKHWIHRRHLDHARKPTKRDRASFIPADFEMLETAGAFTYIAGDASACPLPGVRWELSYGHTPAQLLPLFEGADGQPGLLFVGDVVPTATHLPHAWIMAYDLEPLKTLQERERVYQRCQREGLMLAFPHDPKQGIITVCFDERGKPAVGTVIG